MSDPAHQGHRVPRWADLLGVAWIVAAAVAVLGPALAHGSSLGPFDTLSRFGLSYNPRSVVTNSPRGDLVNAMNVWTTLAWRQVHTGQLPLWNPYSAMGMPLAFNWQSAPFSVPALVGYLFPLPLDSTVQSTMTLVIAGTGAYVLARSLRLGVLASAFGATVFELSGAMIGWLGWPHAAVMSWGGWLFAAALLVVRGRRRSLSIALLALVVACAIYAGQPEVLVLLGSAVIIFLVGYIGLRALDRFGGGPVLRPVLDLAFAGAVGLALGAPLVLPGLQLEQVSLRNSIPPDHALPAHNLAYLVFQGYDGLPISGSHWFGYFFYVETAAYIGVIALVMAGLGVAMRWRKPEVPALGAVALVMFAIAYFPPLNTLLDRLPGIGHILWHRSLLPMSFALAILAAQGVHVVVTRWRDTSVQVVAASGFAIAALIIVGLWVLDRGHLSHAQEVLRDRSFTGPMLATLIGLVTVGSLVVLSGRRSHSPDDPSAWRQIGVWAGLVLLLGEAAFLVGAGAPLMQSSSTYFAETPGETALQDTVGDSTVAFGTPTVVCTGLGIIPNVNAVYGIKELALYDPMVPSAYFSSFRDQTGQPAGSLSFYSYCPAINSARLARLYGVGYILVPQGAQGPAGTTFVRNIVGESLYRVPGSSPATAVSTAHPQGVAVPVTHPSPSTWRLVVRTARPENLRLRLTAVPGWQVSIDGRPASARTYQGIMLQVAVPAGTNTVVLHYWPKAFTAGIILGILGLCAIVTAILIEHLWGRRRSPHE